MSDQIEEDADRLAATLRRMAAAIADRRPQRFDSVRDVLVNYGLTDRLIDWVLEDE